MAGIDARTVQRIENGEREPRPGTIQAIAKALGVDLGQLYGGCRDHGPAPHAEQTPSGRVTLIASPKAGTGRTTLAITLAGALLKPGCRVLLVDFHEACGVQPHLSWADTLRRARPEYRRFESPAKATLAIPELQNRYDHVVIDSSTCETSDLVPLALRCNHILLTTDHPQMDFGWGGHRTQTWLDVANVYRADVAAVLMCVSRYRSHRLEARRCLERMGLRVLNAELVKRTAYDRAGFRGATVIDDDPTGLAASEVYALGHELGWMDFPQSPRSLRDRKWTNVDERFRRAFFDHIFLRDRIVRPSQRRTTAKGER